MKNQYCTPERQAELVEKNRKFLCATLTKAGIPITDENIDLADKMNGHDWYFNYSDDHRKWSSGNRVACELERIKESKKFDDYKQIWDLFCPWGRP